MWQLNTVPIHEHFLVKHGRHWPITFMHRQTSHKKFNRLQPNYSSLKIGNLRYQLTIYGDSIILWKHCRKPKENYNCSNVDKFICSSIAPSIVSTNAISYYRCLRDSRFVPIILLGNIIFYFKFMIFKFLLSTLTKNRKIILKWNRKAIVNIFHLL